MEYVLWCVECRAQGSVLLSRVWGVRIKAQLLRYGEQDLRRGGIEGRSNDSVSELSRLSDDGDNGILKLSLWLSMSLSERALAERDVSFSASMLPVLPLDPSDPSGSYSRMASHTSCKPIRIESSESLLLHCLKREKIASMSSRPLRTSLSAPALCDTSSTVLKRRSMLFGSFSLLYSTELSAL